MKLYNTVGQEVATIASGLRDAGMYDLFFDARSRSSGVCCYQLQYGLQAATNRMAILTWRNNSQVIFLFEPLPHS